MNHTKKLVFKKIFRGQSIDFKKQIASLTPSFFINYCPMNHKKKIFKKIFWGQSIDLKKKKFQVSPLNFFIIYCPMKHTKKLFFKKVFRGQSIDLKKISSLTPSFFLLIIVQLTMQKI